MSVVQYATTTEFLSNEYSQKYNELKHAQKWNLSKQQHAIAQWLNGTQVRAIGHEGQNSHMQTRAL